MRRLIDRLSALQAASAVIFAERMGFAVRLDCVDGDPRRGGDPLVSESLPLKIRYFLFFLFCHERTPFTILLVNEGTVLRKRHKKISPPGKILEGLCVTRRI